MSTEVYTHGHHESVLRSHTWRTAENSAAYLLPELRPGLALLDVGCGPGTITIDLAQRVAPGRCAGIDRASKVIEKARAYAAGKGVGRRVLERGRVRAAVRGCLVRRGARASGLATPDRSGARAARAAARAQARRAVRSARQRLLVLFVGAARSAARALARRCIARCAGATRRAGRGTVPQALGARRRLRDRKASSSTWTYADAEACAWWGGLWADRCLHSAFGDQAVQYGLATREELAEIAAAFRQWAAAPDAFFAVLHGEVLAR